MNNPIDQARELIIEKQDLTTTSRERFNKILSEKLADAVLEAEKEYNETAFQQQRRKKSK